MDSATMLSGDSSMMDKFFEPLPPAILPRTQGGNRAFYNIANDYTHIADPNLRRRLALSDIDRVPLGLYHVRTVLVAGIGFFLDSYGIFAINLITTFLGIVFWQGSPDDGANGYGGNYGVLPTSVSQALKVSTSAGIVVGQVLFGWLSDQYGRRRIYGIELGIILLSTLNCALASPSPAVTTTGLLTFWRVAMGVGIGGDYPLSSVIISEFAPTRWRGGMMAAVFSMQGIGQLTAAIVALIVTVAFRESFMDAKDIMSCHHACRLAADRSWRIIVGAGAVPACIALYYRITIPETPRFTFDVVHDVEKGDADIKAYMASQSEGVVDPIHRARMMKVAGPSLAIPSASWPDVFSYFRQWKNLRVLIGTTFSWFFLDFAFYGLGLNNTIVLKAIGYAGGDTLYHTLYNNAVGMIILTCAGSLPGYWISIVTIDSLGRKPLQIFGFLILTAIFCIIGFAYDKLSQASMLGLYVVAQALFNWGPNTTTFVIPGECYPTRYRSLGHGLSAAMGKVGAIAAQLISVPLVTSNPDLWVERLMQLFALLMLCGAIVSLLVPETRGMTLEELSGESSGGTPTTGHGPAARLGVLSPFAGGKRAGLASSHGRTDRSRTSIMASPELAARGAGARENGGFWHRRTPRKGGSDAGSGDFTPSDRSGGSDLPIVQAGASPGWGEGGEGGGRGVSRGGTDSGLQWIPLEHVRLRDVGSLLR